MHDAVGLVHREVAQVPATDYGEDGRVDAEAQRQRHDDRCREPPLLDEQSRRETEVVQEGIDGRQSAGFAMSLVKGCRATHPNQCGAPRFGGCHASTKVVFGEHRNMRLQFLLEVTIEVAASEERAAARPPLLQRAAHASPPRAKL
jgi:hypothetical protein